MLRFLTVTFILGVLVACEGDRAPLLQPAVEVAVESGQWTYDDELLRLDRRLGRERETADRQPMSWMIQERIA